MVDHCGRSLSKVRVRDPHIQVRDELAHSICDLAVFVVEVERLAVELAAGVTEVGFTEIL